VDLPPPILVVFVAVVIATVTDMRMFKIHNVLTLPLIVSGLVYHGLTGGPEKLMDSAIGTLVGFGIVFVMFMMGGMGGGDVKLMAGIGAWLGAPATILIFLAASLAAGVYSLALIIAHGRVRETWVNLRIISFRALAIGRHLAAEDKVEETVQKEDRRARLIPFGAMVCIGLSSLILIARFMPPASHAAGEEHEATAEVSMPAVDMP
jgi:prepilin peptidase CpaA